MKSEDKQVDFQQSRDSVNTDSKLKLLIIQTSQSAQALADRLEEASYSITWQQIATEAEYCTYLRQGCDLVIADYTFTGFEVADALRLLQESALDIPLIVVNGAPSATAAVECMKAGAADYLLSERQLPEAIEQVLVAKTRLQRQQTQTREQFKTLIAENADGIIVVDRHRNVQFINPAAQALLGFQAAELIGQGFGFPVVGSDYLEVDLPSTGGDYRVAQMRVAQIQWHEDTAYLISLRDITALKRIETERIELLEQAEAANRAKDEFLAILSHELRTPLNPILGWTQLMQSRKLDEDKTAMALKTIERNVNLQIQLIEDLLDISRITQGKLKLKARRVNLAIAISSALETVQLAAQAKSIQIKTNLERNGFVWGDLTRLQQVVWNLLSNAIKFTPAGGQIAVCLSAEGKLACLQVSDTGKGISPEFLPHVFDYFCQADSATTRAAGGLGLGLTIVRHLVELHGGTVAAQSPGLGKGSTFTVTLPIMAHSEESISKKSASATDSSLEGVRILIVEDEVDVRDLLVFALEHEGAQVMAVATAAEALAAITQSSAGGGSGADRLGTSSESQAAPLRGGYFKQAQFKPEVLVSDIAISEMDGYELMRSIRALPAERGGNVPALALSAYAADSDRQRSLEAGFNRHLSKPVALDDLIAAIAQLLDDRR